MFIAPVIVKLEFENVVRLRLNELAISLTSAIKIFELLFSSIDEKTELLIEISFPW